MATDKKKELNIQCIQQELESFPVNEISEVHDLVIILGEKGQGKSTLCNSLAGYSLRETEFGEAETVGDTGIKIGSSFESCTLLPKLCMAQDPTSCGKEIYLLDTAGINDNRSIEHRIVTSCVLEMAVLSALHTKRASDGQIRGFLFVIMYDAFMIPRSEYLQNLVKYLVTLFRDPIKMLQYSFFVFTNCSRNEKEAKRNIEERFNGLLVYFESQLKNLDKLNSIDNFQKADIIRMIEFIKCTLKFTDRFVVYNALDKGESRLSLFKKLNTMKPADWFLEKYLKISVDTFKQKVFGYEVVPSFPKIQLEDFTFDDCTEERRIFNATASDLLLKGDEVIYSIKSNAQRYAQLISEVIDSEERLSAWQKLLPALQERLTTGNDEECYKLANFSKNLNKVNQQLRDRQNKCQGIEAEIKKTVTEMSELDNDKPVLFLRKSVKKWISWIKFFGWDEQTFTFDTGDPNVKFLFVEKEKHNGSWQNEVNDLDEGRYSITFVSEYYARPLSACVRTFVESRHLSEHKDRIQQLSLRLTKLNGDKAKLASEIEKFSEERQFLIICKEDEAQNLRDDDDNTRRKISDTSKNIAIYKEKVEEKKKEKATALDLGLKALKEFEGKRPKLDTVLKILELLSFNNTILKDFVVKYRDFLIHFDDHKKILCGNIDPISLNSLTEIKDDQDVVELFDPITNQPIKDLVVTKLGTTFDEYSLMKKYDTSLKNPPPFVFTHPDGSEEKIPYLGWEKIRDIQDFRNKLEKQKLSCKNPSAEPPYYSFSGMCSMSVEELEELVKKLQIEIEDLKGKILVKDSFLLRVQTQLTKMK